MTGAEITGLKGFFAGDISKEVALQRLKITDTKKFIEIQFLRIGQGEALEN